MTKKWAEDSNWPCFHSAEVDSTNSWAKSDFKLKDRSLYIADHQSDGRGRNQNTWINSSPGDSFLSTWAFKRSAPPPVVLPIRIGYFLFSALKETWPQIPFSLKAPNDILIRGNKCSGVLIEAVTTTSTEIYVGLGINVLSSPEIPDRNVTSLSQELDSKKISFSDWSHFCYALSNNFLNAVQNNDPLLNTTETLLLKSALNLYYDGTLSAIHNDGSMVFKNGDTIPWNNL